MRSGGAATSQNHGNKKMDFFNVTCRIKKKNFTECGDEQGQTQDLDYKELERPEARNETASMQYVNEVHALKIIHPQTYVLSRQNHWEDKDTRQ